MDAHNTTLSTASRGSISHSSTPLQRRSAPPPSPRTPVAVLMPVEPNSLPSGPLMHAVTDIQEQLYKAQGELTRCRAKLSTAKDELSTVQQQLAAAKSDVNITQAQREDALDRLRRCQEQLEHARREAAAESLKNVTLTAERDDLSEKVREAWEKVASLGHRLTVAEAQRSPQQAPLSPADDSRAVSESMMVVLAESQRQQLLQAREEVETLRVRCQALERVQATSDNQLTHSSGAFTDALAGVVTLLEKARGVSARRLLPLDKVVSSPANSITESDRREVLALLEELERRATSATPSASAASAACRPLLRAARALISLLDAVHEDALRLSAARTAAAKEKELLYDRAQRAQAELAQLQQQQEGLHTALRAQHDAQEEQVASRERESVTACRTLAAMLNCLEDWSMVKHRVQHLQQQSAEWECEVGNARRQLSSVRAESEAALQRQATASKGERLALSEEARRLAQELATLRDEHEALVLEHQYGAQAGNAAVAAAAGTNGILVNQVAALTAELDKLKREHTSLQATHKEALHCIEEELEPFAEEQERRARRAEAQMKRLEEDKEQLYGVVEVLRAQLRGLRPMAQGRNEGPPVASANAPKHDDSVPAPKQQQSVAPPGNATEHRDGGVSSTSNSRDSDDTRSSDAHHRLSHAPRYPQALPISSYRGARAAAETASEPMRAGHSIPYPAPVLSLSSANTSGGYDDKENSEQRRTESQGASPAQSTLRYASQTHSHGESHAKAEQRQKRLIEDEEALHSSIQQDRREAAYASGRLRTSDPGLGSSHLGAGTSSANKFATEVLGVIEALDKRVTGALQRNGRVDA